MPLNKFEEQAESLTEHDDFATYINGVKTEAVGTEYHGAVLHELNRATQNVFNQLFTTNDQSTLVLLVGELRGLRLASRYIEAQWPIDKETEE